MKKHFLFALLLVFSAATAQQFLRPNEEIVYTFQTKNGKTMLLAKDKKDGYLVYRFGKKDKIEMEFGGKDKQSWKQFRYSFYFRGGGKANSGLDLDNLWFVKDGFEYLVYFRYSAGDDENKASTDFGIRVTDLKTQKSVEIPGKENTDKGSLQQFRTNNLVEIDTDRID